MSIFYSKNGGGGGTINVPDSLRFANTIDRDGYFVTNPTKLQKDVYVTVVDQLQRYNGDAFENTAVVIKGQRGEVGQQGEVGDHVDSAAFVGDDIVFGDTGGREFPLVDAKHTLKGSTGASVISGAFIENDLILTKDDNTTATVVDAALTLKGDKGDKIVLAEFEEQDIRFDYEDGTNFFLSNARGILRGDEGPEGKSFLVQFSPTSTGPWYSTYSADRDFFIRHSTNSGFSWSDAQPYRQLSQVDISNPVTLNLGNLRVASSGDVMGTHNALRHLSSFPVSNFVTDSGNFIRASEAIPTDEVITDVLFAGLPDMSSEPVPYDYSFTPAFNEFILSSSFLPMEDYTGKVYYDTLNENGSTLIARSEQLISVISGQVSEVKIELRPVQVITAGVVYRSRIIRSDTLTPLLVRRGAQPQNPANIEPYRKVATLPYSQFSNVTLHPDDITQVARELERLSGESRLDAASLKNITQLLSGIGSPKGAIVFSASDLNQFAGMTKNDSYRAEEEGTIGNVAFGVGDRLVCINSLPDGFVPTTLNDNTYFIVEKNIQSVATSTTAGVVKPSNDFIIDTQGKIAPKDATETVRGVVKTNVIGGVPSIQPNGKLALSVIPALDTGEILVVEDQAARLSLPISSKLYLVTQQDIRERFGLNPNVNPASLANWISMGSTELGVTTFNTRVGGVLPESGDYTADQITQTESNVFLSEMQKNSLLSLLNSQTTASAEQWVNTEQYNAGSFVRDDDVLWFSPVQIDANGIAPSINGVPWIPITKKTTMLDSDITLKHYSDYVINHTNPLSATLELSKISTQSNMVISDPTQKLSTDNECTITIIGILNGQTNPLLRLTTPCIVTIKRTTTGQFYADIVEI